MIRFGITEKMNPNVQSYSLQSLVEKNLAADNNMSKEERVQMETEVSPKCYTLWDGSQN